MKARLVKFGEIEVEGTRYTHDVVIDGGKVRKRKKGPSKEFREKFGHTPLSAGEEIPWGGKRLLVGTGADGALPIMEEVLVEARSKRRSTGASSRSCKRAPADSCLDSFLQSFCEGGQVTSLPPNEIVLPRIEVHLG
jgi:hypothetical protein